MKFLGKVNDFLVKLLMKIQPPVLRYFVLVALAFGGGAGSAVSIDTPWAESHNLNPLLYVTCFLSFALVIDYFVVAYGEQKGIESGEKLG